MSSLPAFRRPHMPSKPSRARRVRGREPSGGARASWKSSLTRRATAAGSRERISRRTGPPATSRRGGACFRRFVTSRCGSWSLGAGRAAPRCSSSISFRVSTIVCADTFGGTPEESHVYDRLTALVNTAEARFDRNLAPFGQRVEKIKARSDEALARLAEQGRRFDLAYIDAGHRRDDVMRDLLGTWAPDGPGRGL